MISHAAAHGVEAKQWIAVRTLRVKTSVAARSLRCSQ